MLEDLVHMIEILENVLYGDVPDVMDRLYIPHNALAPIGNKVNVRVTEGVVIPNLGEGSEHNSKVGQNNAPLNQNPENIPPRVDPPG